MFETDKRPHISVVGDLILDRYLIGDATKLNPEQPGVVIRVRKEDERLGGAAAVASIASGLGAHVTLAGVLGRDESGRRTLALVDSCNVAVHIWRGQRPTTWKQRIVVDGQIRPDRCDREVTRPIPGKAADFLSTTPLGHILLIQDYGKGVCTKQLVSMLVTRAREMNVPVLVDPARGRQWSDYGPVSLIKANWAEASEACGIAKCSPRDLALTLSERHDCSVVITRGKRGLVCAERKGDTWTLPAPCVTARDVCGAGDTILATIGVAIARGDSLHRACTQAVAAAAEQVTKIGVSIIDCKTRHAHTSPAGQLDDNYCDLTVSVHDDNAIAKSRTRDLQVAGP